MSILELPNLPYSYDALEPAIDARTMEIHHQKHHAGYLKKLVAALEAQNISCESLVDLESILHNIESDTYNETIRNNAGGFYNHAFFWETMTPGGKALPDGKFKELIREEFGNPKALEERFYQQATSLFGSGWTWLCIGQDNKLLITTTHNQDNPLMSYKKSGLIPLIGLDVWEHAYYLQYQNRRADYVKAFRPLLNWEVVNKRYEATITC